MNLLTQAEHNILKDKNKAVRVTIAMAPTAYVGQKLLYFM